MNWGFVLFEYNSSLLYELECHWRSIESVSVCNWKVPIVYIALATLIADLNQKRDSCFQKFNKACVV